MPVTHRQSLPLFHPGLPLKIEELSGELRGGMTDSTHHDDGLVRTHPGGDGGVGGGGRNPGIAHLHHHIHLLQKASQFFLGLSSVRCGVVKA